MNSAISRVFIVGVSSWSPSWSTSSGSRCSHAGGLQAAPREPSPASPSSCSVKRGLILGFDGSTIAGDARRSGFYYRTYPQGPIAPQIVGYDSVRYGQTGIESSMNELPERRQPRHSGADRQAARPPQPRAPTSSSPSCRPCRRWPSRRSAAQVGAIVALDPKTGALIAAASAPSYNPATIDTSFAQARQGPRRAAAHRASTQGLYPPGSSFKVVTATAALNLGKVTPTHALRRHRRLRRSTAARSPTTTARSSATTTSPRR